MDCRFGRRVFTPPNVPGRRTLYSDPTPSFPLVYPLLLLVDDALSGTRFMK